MIPLYLPSEASIRASSEPISRSSLSPSSSEFIRKHLFLLLVFVIALCHQYQLLWYILQHSATKELGILV